MTSNQCIPVQTQWVEIQFFGKGKGIGEVHHRTGHEGPEGEERYSSTLSLTSALDEGGGQCHPLATLPPRERDPIPTA